MIYTFNYAESHEDFRILLSPRAGLNRWPRPYQGRALPTELQGQYGSIPLTTGIEPPAALQQMNAKYIC